MSAGPGFRLLLTGGGTGGHLFPAVATAQNMQNRQPDSKILFIGTKRKLDKEHLGRDGFEVRTVHSFGLKGKKLPALLKALAILPVTICEAMFHLLRFQPDVVCGVGGYVTGPVVAAAWLLRIPTIIHEQNSVPGLANRKLAKIVDRICISLPDSESYFPPEKTFLTGNPVRSQILETASLPVKCCGAKKLLILGGSQGANAINEVIVKVLTSNDPAYFKIKVVHQTGITDEGWVKQAYLDHDIDAEVSAFFNDMARIYKDADLVVSRAGATTLAELAVIGKPAILIPYPYAADNHQEKNGSRYAEGGGAILMSQEEATAEKLDVELKKMLCNQEKLESMSISMKEMGIVDAADRIVDICLELTGEK